MFHRDAASTGTASLIRPQGDSVLRSGDGANGTADDTARSGSRSPSRTAIRMISQSQAPMIMRPNSTGISVSPSSGNADTRRHRYRKQPLPKLHPPPTIDRLRTCRDVLLRAFTFCTDDDSEDLCCAISCTMNATRSLHVAETQSAVGMHAYAQYSQQYWMRRLSDDFQAWLLNFGALFAINDAGYVSFTLPEMQHFLRNVRIRGIDSSHRTIAKICYALMELHHSNQGESGLCAFSSYAAQNWQFHYRIAARTSISLRYERTVRKRARSNDKGNVSPSMRRGNSPSSVTNVQLGLEDLEIRDGPDEWVLIEPP